MQLPLPLPILLSLTTTTTALWIATANMDYQTATPGGAIFPSPFCQVGKGDTAEQAHSQAARTVDATAIIAGGHCDQLPYQHTNQLGGFWDDYGTVFYVDGDWQCHAYLVDAEQDFCSIRLRSVATCMQLKSNATPHTLNQLIYLEPKMTDQTPVWFITAAASGFGKAMALEALSRGHKVIASGRYMSRLVDLETAGADIMVLDVCSPLSDIETVAEEANAKYGYITHLVNVAGYVLVGAVEETSFVSLLQTIGQTTNNRHTVLSKTSEPSPQTSSAP
ncbi:conserved hypothetical protein [Pyrenophora tritici-repentis Pt-1C-BFP]|uniref:Uncharacterized protein n=1 Tax=Pyrenophora tritici-repentis (strain Pt-1C-BFP) TaxID=426418 RepID=B2WHM0_PYRTR|nr:uncharacterized protein PTRG_09479 [Pyrenophora tritici-repentis Pt-1C-BFP]EDU42530.1 conserved hypothetical protein [Pyrenophora tritici-repentis Pt-1C-BFP]